MIPVYVHAAQGEYFKLTGRSGLAVGGDYSDWRLAGNGGMEEKMESPAVFRVDGLGLRVSREWRNGSLQLSLLYGSFPE